MKERPGPSSRAFFFVRPFAAGRPEGEVFALPAALWDMIGRCPAIRAANGYASSFIGGAQILSGPLWIEGDKSDALD